MKASTRLFFFILVVLASSSLVVCDLLIGRDDVSQNIIMMNDDGTNQVAIASGKASGLAVSGANYLYYRDSKNLYLVNFNRPFPNSKILMPLNSSFDIGCMAPAGRKLYMYLKSPNSIVTTTLSGTLPSVLLASVSAGNYCDRLIVYGGYIYLLVGDIFRVKARAGSAAVDIIPTASLDPICTTKTCTILDFRFANKLIWMKVIINGVGKIMTANVDGTNLKVLVTSSFQFYSYTTGFALLSNNDIVVSADYLPENYQLRKFSSANSYTGYTNVTTFDAVSFSGDLVSISAGVPTTPTTPIGFAALPAISLSWNAVAGATSYTIQYKPTSSSTWLSYSTASTHAFITSGVTSGTWDVEIKATTHTVSSAYSSSMTVTVA